MKAVIAGLLLFAISTGVEAAHSFPEKVYQDQWCAEQGGVTEYRLDDGTRVDCLTDDYAIEFDFAPKWAESVGQSLYYAERTGRRPSVVLIMEHVGDDRYTIRLDTLAQRYNIKVWQVTPQLVTNIPPNSR